MSRISSFHTMQTGRAVSLENVATRPTTVAYQREQRLLTLEQRVAALEAQVLALKAAQHSVP